MPQVDIQIKGKDQASPEFKKVQDSANKATKAIENGFKRAGESIKKVGEGVKNAGVQLSKASAGFALIEGAAVRSAARMETSLTNVSTLIKGDSTQAVKTFETGIKSMLSTIPKSADELGAGLYPILSAGITDADAALKTLEASAKLGVGGLGSTAEAINLVTVATNAFGLDASRADTTANTLFKTVKNGITDVGQLSTNFGAMAGEAAAVDASFEDTLAALAALTSITGSTAKEQTRLAALFREVGDAQGPLAQAIEKNNGSYEKFRQTVSEQGIGAALVQLRDELGLTDEQMKLMFGSAEAGGAAFGLLTKANEAYTNTLSDMKGGTDDLTEAFEKQIKTAENQWQLFKNKFNRVLITLGNQILPILVPAMQKVGDAIGRLGERFEKLSPGMQKAIVIMGAIAAAIGPVVLAIGSIIGVIGGAVAGWGVLTAAIAAAAPVLGTIAAAIVAALPVIAAIGAAIALVAVAWKKNWFDIQGKTKVAWDGITKVVGEGIDIIKWGLRNASDFFKTIAGGITSFAKNWVKNFKETWSSPLGQIITLPFKIFKDSVVKILGPIGELVGGKIQGVIDKIKGVWSDTHAKAVQDEASSFMSKVGERMGKAFEDVALGGDERKKVFAQILVDMDEFYVDSGDKTDKWTEQQKQSWEGLRQDVANEAGDYADTMKEVVVETEKAAQGTEAAVKKMRAGIDSGIKDIDEAFEKLIPAIDEVHSSAFKLEKVDPGLARDKYLELADMVSEFVDSNLHNMDQWSDNQKSIVFGTIKDIEEALKKLYSKGIDIGEPDIAIADKMNLIRKLLAEEGFKAFEAWDTGISPIIDRAGELPLDIAKAIKGKSGNVEKAMAELGMEGASAMEIELEEGTKDAVDNMSDTFEIQIERAEENFKDLMEDGIREAVRVMDDAMEDELDILKDNFDGVMEGIEQDFEDTINKIKAEQEKLKGTKGEMGALEDIRSQLESLLSQAQQASATLAEEAPVFDADAVDPEKAQEAWQDFQEELKEFNAEQENAQALLDILSSRFAEVLARGGGIAEELLAGVAGTPLEPEIQNLIALFNSYATQASQGLGTVGFEVDALDNILLKLGYDWDDTTDLINENLEEMGKQLDDETNSARENFEQMKEDAKKSFEESTDAVEAEFEDMQEKLENGTVSIADAFEQLGIEITDSLTEAFKKAGLALDDLNKKLPTGEEAAAGVGTLQYGPGENPLLNYLQDQFGIRIPGYQRGGIFSKPSIIGVGEGVEPEAVAPISELRSMIGAGEGAKQPIIVNQNIQWYSMLTPTEVDMRRFYQDSYRILQEVMKQNGLAGL